MGQSKNISLITFLKSKEETKGIKKGIITRKEEVSICKIRICKFNLKEDALFVNASYLKQGIIYDLLFQSDIEREDH